MRLPNVVRVSLAVIAPILVAMAVAAARAEAPPDTYVVHTDAPPATLDPARAYDTPSSVVLENLYETLVAFDRDEIATPAPHLALGHEVSADGTTYTFALRPNVTFHSGNPFTCRDAEYSLERGLVTAHPEGAFANLLGPLLIGTDVDGSDPASYAADVGFARIDATVRCLDDLTLQLTMVRPDASLLAVLAHPAFGIVDRAWAVSMDQWDGTAGTWTGWIGRDLTAESMHASASGTGAYRLVSWDDEALVAEAFPAYWGDPPALPRVLIAFVEEQSLRVLAARQGEADRISLRDRAFLSQLRAAPNVTVHERAEWSAAAIDVVLLNFAIDTTGNEFVGSGTLDGSGIPPDFFADPDVRRGFAHLFDHARYVEDVLQGEGMPLAMALPPSFLGYATDLPLRTLDRDAAERYLRRAHGGLVWDRGFAFAALAPPGRGRDALSMLADNLQSLNPAFRMDVVELARPVYFERLAAGHAPLTVVGWSADHADPSNFVDTFYTSSGPAASFTDIGFEQLDDLAVRARRETDPAVREALYHEVGRLQHELVPVIPLPLGTPFLVTSRDLQGVYYNPLLGHNYLWRSVSK